MLDGATAQDGTTAAQAFRRMLMGFRTTQMIHVAAKLNIADLLADGPLSADDLAKTAGANPRALYRLLRALASLGIFAEREDGRFQLTPLAEPLRSTAVGSLHGAAVLYGEPWCWRAYGELLHSVKTGEPAFDHAHGLGIFDYCQQNPQAAAVFNRAMTDFTGQEVAAILEAYDFSVFKIVVDVGGGHGAFLADLLAARRELRGILYDLPHAMEGARKLMAEAGVAERCAIVSGNFFQSAPQGGDLYLLKRVIHDWDDERAVAILKNCRDAIPDAGRLLVMEKVIPPGNTPSEATLFDINMVVSAGGMERTEAEYRALLARAGFVLTQVISTARPLSLIEAVRT